MSAHAPRVLALVTFPAARLAPDALRQRLQEAGPRYLGVPGLRRKYFLAADGIGGGAYEWESRAAAERYHDAAWLARLEASCGARPELRWFEVPALADGERDEFLLFGR